MNFAIVEKHQKSFFDGEMSPTVGETVHGACEALIADNSISRTVSCGTAFIRITLDLQTPLPWWSNFFYQR